MAGLAGREGRQESTSRRDPSPRSGLNAERIPLKRVSEFIRIRWGLKVSHYTPYNWVKDGKAGIKLGTHGHLHSTAPQWLYTSEGLIMDFLKATGLT